MNPPAVSIDPGESIGIITQTSSGTTVGRTIKGERRLEQLWYHLKIANPDVIVYEEFALRQGAAMKLVGSKFITCEVIGVIKLYAQIHACRLVPLIPANKEYCGFSSSPKDIQYTNIHMFKDEKITEHVRDAYRLYSYAKLFKEV